MKKLYSLYLFIGIFLLPSFPKAQSCVTLNATFKSFESRCAATGAIKVFPVGGSGIYKYKVSGPVNTDFTTSDSITGLSAGVYSVEVVDVNLNCRKVFNDVAVDGNYSDPRFELTTQSVGCDNGSNGIITVTNLQNGRDSFAYSIVAPSPMGIGTTSTNGVFSGLIAGNYSIRLTDSCGGIQTRTVTIDNYTWWIDSYNFTKYSCDSAYGYLKVLDSRGNISTAGGIPGMMYGVVTSSGDTLWSGISSFGFLLNGASAITALAMDTCHNIKKIQTSVFLLPSLNSSVALSDYTCNTFSASVTGIKNFFNPEFCIYDENGTEISCNSTGKFTGLSYGNYCIRAHDECTDSTITRCFSASAPVISVGAQVAVSNKNCNSFTASVTGQANLTNPEYCVFDSNNVQIDCNTTGVFDNLMYGSYCIATHNGCIDTTITRCFTVSRPMPRIPDQIIPSYINCINFGLNVQGDSLTSPTFCLNDTLGNTISCNATGIFDSIPLGNYCVTIYDACLDTTFHRCFSVGAPQVANDMAVSISNKACNTFTATLLTSNLAGGAFCLYDSMDNLINCDSSGKFINLLYGSYCLKATLTCPDTTLIKCFTAIPRIPSMDSKVSINNRTCSTFSAKVTGQTNLTNPVYYLTGDSGDTLASNTSGTFPGLAYGNYCILVEDGCYDTTIQRCFSATPPVFSSSVSVARSCNYGFSRLAISMSTYPAQVYIYDSSYFLIQSATANGSLVIDGIASVPGNTINVVSVDDCGATDTVKVTWKGGYINHRADVNQKCPGATWIYGSGDINAIVTTNTGALTVRIIKKDGNNYSPYLNPNYAKDSTYTFRDLGPGTYILSYNSNDGCNVYVYDTVVIAPYAYPNLERSSAYQCDKNGFSVGAVVSNGVGPFTYEIIGSSPASPSIVSGPQTNPVFNIDNGANYSLIRLRVLDDCGNATLGDASILPLANYGIMVNENCIGMATTLKIDTLYNGSISWYFKTTPEAQDSTYLGNDFSYSVDPLMYSDTGYYYCNISVNNGCIARRYQFNLTGDCYPVLPVLTVELKGLMYKGKSYLSWSTKNDAGLKAIKIERKKNENFLSIGNLSASDFSSPGFYHFTDDHPLYENYYRLRLEFADGKVAYSNVIYLESDPGNTIRVYPNPAVREVNISLPDLPNPHWRIELGNITGQKSVIEKQFTGRNYLLRRNKSIASGMYILKVVDLNSGKEYNFPVIFYNQ